MIKFDHQRITCTGNLDYNARGMSPVDQIFSVLILPETFSTRQSALYFRPEMVVCIHRRINIAGNPEKVRHRRKREEEKTRSIETPLRASLVAAKDQRKFAMALVKCKSLFGREGLST